jgi:hypothetical protein
MSDDVLARLYPHLSDAELDDARENIKQYLLMVAQIYERIRHDPEAWQKFCALTNKKTNSTLPGERSEKKRTLKT